LTETTFPAALGTLEEGNAYTVSLLGEAGGSFISPFKATMQQSRYSEISQEFFSLHLFFLKGQQKLRSSQVSFLVI